MGKHDFKTIEDGQNSLVDFVSDWIRNTFSWNLKQLNHRPSERLKWGCRMRGDRVSRSTFEHSFMTFWNFGTDGRDWEGTIIFTASSQVGKEHFFDWILLRLIKCTLFVVCCDFFFETLSISITKLNVYLVGFRQ